MCFSCSFTKLPKKLPVLNETQSKRWLYSHCRPCTCCSPPRLVSPCDQPRASQTGVHGKGSGGSRRLVLQLPWFPLLPPHHTCTCDLTGILWTYSLGRKCFSLICRRLYTICWKHPEVDSSKPYSRCSPNSRGGK